MTDNSINQNNNNIKNDDSSLDEIKQQIYEIYETIKTSLLKNQSLNSFNSSHKEITSTSKINSIISSIKDLIKLIINSEKYTSSKKTLNYTDNQIESYIRKLEYDIKYYIKELFQYKIKKDALEIKIRGYMEIEEEFEELKEKVKYDEGKFLNNDRKDNEIIILRRENSNLKKEITKLENKNKEYETKSQEDQNTIKTLKYKISQLNQKITEINNTNTINTNNYNENDIGSKSINQSGSNSNNINDYYNMTVNKKYLDNFSKKYKQTYNNNLIDNPIGINNNNNITHFHLKNNYQSSSCSNLNIPRPENNKNIHIRSLNTIDANNKMIASAYNKIYNGNNINKNITPIRSNNINQNNVKRFKSNSVSMRLDENNKSELMNKNVDNHGRNTSQKLKNICKISKNPKNVYRLGQYGSNNNFPRKYIQRELQRPYEQASINIIAINK